MSIRVFDMSGRLTLQRLIRPSHNGTAIIVLGDARTSASGMYLVTVTAGSKTLLRTAAVLSAAR